MINEKRSHKFKEEQGGVYGRVEREGEREERREEWKEGQREERGKCCN